MLLKYFHGSMAALLPLMINLKQILADDFQQLNFQAYKNYCTILVIYGVIYLHEQIMEN